MRELPLPISVRSISKMRDVAPAAAPARICAIPPAAYNSPMAIIRKCDACKRVIPGGDRTSVDTFSDYKHFELCNKCAAPILAVLKRYKLTA